MALVAAEAAESALAAAGLSEAQLAQLPTALQAASAAIERWCDRAFARASYAEILGVGHDGTAMLRAWPVHTVTRLAAGRTAAITITNATALRATVAPSYPEGDDPRALPVGLTLVDVAGGSSGTHTLLFDDHPTVGELAAAVDELGDGWSAEVLGGFGDWPSAELVADGPARATGSGATLDLFAEDLDAGDYAIDRPAGIVRVRTITPSWDPWLDFAGPSSVAVAGDALRVEYSAGFAAIPADVQAATIEAAKAMLQGHAADPAIVEESGLNYSYKLRSDADRAVAALGTDVLRTLATYRGHRA